MKGFLIEAWSYKENKQVCWGTTRLAKAGSLQQRGDLPSAFLVNQIIKNPPAMCETQVQPLGGKHPWRREWLSTPVFMPGESHGQKSLVGYSPWGRRVRHDWATTTTQTKFKLQGYSFHRLLPKPKEESVICFHGHIF